MENCDRSPKPVDRDDMRFSITTHEDEMRGVRGQRGGDEGE